MEYPTILFHGSYDSDALGQLKRLPISQEIDLIHHQLNELFEIEHASLAGRSNNEDRRQYIFQKIGHEDDSLYGDWIYYPWSKVLVHSVSQNEFFALRTNRNQLLITPEEQQKIYKSTIAIAGLSIGSHFALSLAHVGIGGYMKLADSDTLSTTNLNRIGATLKEVGLPKLQIISRQLYEANPYQKIVGFPDGIDDGSVHSFVAGDRPADIVFEALDDFAMKVKLRLAARQARKPVVMITNLGDSVLIDIERYDQDPHLPLFNGLVENVETLLDTSLTEQDKVKLTKQVIPPALMSDRILESLSQIGRSLIGRPQLASTVTIGGGIASMVSRLILLGHGCRSGRYRLDAGSVFTSQTASVASLEHEPEA